MASFFSFFINKRIPSPRTVRALLHGPLTLYRAAVYVFLISIVVVIFLILVTINNSFLVTVPARGGSVTEGIIGAPKTINPVLATTDTDKALSALVYAGLIKIMPDGTVINELAEDYTVSPDNRIHTFTLKKSVFQDGKDLTSRDVAFTVSKLKNSALNPSSALYWADISIETPDERTIVFTLPAPRATFLERVAIGILPEHIWGSMTDEEFLSTKKNLTGIGAGPFDVTAINKADGVVEKLTFKRNSHYILGAPLLKKMKVVVFDNQQELLEAIHEKDISFTSQLLPQTITTNTLPKQFITTQVPSVQQVALYHLRGNGGALSNAAFVTLLSQYIDKERIIAIVENGYGEALDSSATPLEIEEVQAKLANAGYQLKNGTLTRAGTSVGISIATTNDPSLVALANTLATELRTLGITVSIRNFDQGFFNTELENNTFSTVLLKGVEPPSSYEAVLPLYTTTVPFIVKSNTTIPIPTVLISPILRYADIHEWYTNTDKLYSWITTNKH